MKRDWNVIREVLLEIEADNNGNSTYGDAKDPIKTGHAVMAYYKPYVQRNRADQLSGNFLQTPTGT